MSEGVNISFHKLKPSNNYVFVILRYFYSVIISLLRSTCGLHLLHVHTYQNAQHTRRLRQPLLVHLVALEYPSTFHPLLNSLARSCQLSDTEKMYKQTPKTKKIEK